MILPGLRVVNLRNEKCDIRVDRRSPWGNPYKIGPGADREQVLAKYREFIRASTRPQLFRMEVERWERDHPDAPECRIGCWCTPERCHADLLIAAAFPECTPGPGVSG